MDDMENLARDPKHRRHFEKLLYLAAQRGDADLVAERLSWGIDPNCTFAKGRTPLIANVPEQVGKIVDLLEGAEGQTSSDGER